jgi:hypothetical protein
MIASYEIIPGFKLPDNEMVIYAKDQPQYLQLPMWKGPYPESRRVARFKLTWKGRLAVLFGGLIWLSVLTFGNSLQPVKLDTECPLMGSAMLDEEV